MREALFAIGLVGGVAALGGVLSWFLGKGNRDEDSRQYGSAGRDLSDGLGREGNGSRSGERAGELGEDRQVGM